MHNKMLHICRVCGYCDEELFPWGEDGETPTFGNLSMLQCRVWL